MQIFILLAEQTRLSVTLSDIPKTGFLVVRPYFGPAPVIMGLLNIWFMYIVYA